MTKSPTEHIPTVIHIATQGDWNPTEVWEGLIALCGRENLDDPDCVATLADLEDDPVCGDEYVCPLCLAHPDYPLLVLANVSE
jgi:hypothetical protein